MEPINTDRKSNQGFGLVEVLVAAGMVALIALGLGTMTTNYMKAERSVAQSASLSQVGSLANMIFNSEVTCRSSGLVGLNIPDPAAVNIQNPVPVRLTLPTGSVFLGTGTSSLPGWNITTLAITQMVDAGPAPTGVATQRAEFSTIIVNGTKTGGSVGSLSGTQTFNVNIVYDSSTHQTIDCYGQLSIAAFCASISGTFDPTAQKCTKVNPEHYVGYSELHQCHSGIPVGGYKSANMSGSDVLSMNAACNRWCKYKGGAVADPVSGISPGCGTSNTYNNYGSGYEAEFNSTAVACACVP